MYAGCEILSVVALHVFSDTSSKGRIYSDIVQVKKREGEKATEYDAVQPVNLQHSILAIEDRHSENFTMYTSHVIRTCTHSNGTRF
jgi:hypothetical protein